MLVKENSETIQPENFAHLEQALGGQFKNMPTVEYKDLTIENRELNPEGVDGAWGEFEYGLRKIYLDRRRIEESDYSEQEVKDHEGLHILERDLLDGKPIYAHLVHALYFGEKEQERLLGMIGTLTHPEVQKILFGSEVELEIKIDKLSLANLIEKTEEALVRFAGRDEEDEKLKERNTAIINLVEANLNDLKTVYFSLCFNEGREVIDFEKALKGLEPILVCYMGDVYSFSDECSIVDSIIKKS